MHFILKHCKKHSTSQSYRKDPEKTRNCNEAPTVYLLPPVEETQLLLSSLAGARELQTFHLTDANRRADPKHWKTARNTREESIGRRPQRFVPASSIFHHGYEASRSKSLEAQHKQAQEATTTSNPRGDAAQEIHPRTQRTPTNLTDQTKRTEAHLDRPGGPKSTPPRRWQRQQAEGTAAAEGGRCQLLPGTTQLHHRSPTASKP